MDPNEKLGKYCNSRAPPGGGCWTRAKNLENIPIQGRHQEVVVGPEQKTWKIFRFKGATRRWLLDPREKLGKYSDSRAPPGGGCWTRTKNLENTPIQGRYREVVVGPERTIWRILQFKGATGRWLLDPNEQFGEYSNSRALPGGKLLDPNSMGDMSIGLHVASPGNILSLSSSLCVSWRRVRE